MRINKTVILPIYIYTTFKYKKIQKKNKDTKLYTTPINFNEWRLMNRFSYSKVKTQYYNEIKEQLKWIKIKKPVRVIYKLYYKNITSDLPNWTSMVSKFFLDSLQKEWCIPDDNVQWVVSEYTDVAEQDRENPRIEARFEYA